MKKMIAIAFVATVTAVPAHAINKHFAQQLERSGCTELNAGVTFDIDKTSAQNANE